MFSHHNCLTVLALTLVVAAGTAAAFAVRQRRRPKQEDGDAAFQPTKKKDDHDIHHIALLGNSMLYYNDCPRLLQCMLETWSRKAVHQDSCLRGGTNLSELWVQGNGMRNKFAGPRKGDPAAAREDIGAPTVKQLLTAKRWDVVVFNDHTQAPARAASAAATRTSLHQYYKPLLRSASDDDDPLVIFIQTPAYQRPNLLGTEDLGDFNRMTALVREGVTSYTQTMDHNAVVGCVGDAFAFVHEKNQERLSRLYCNDHFHPSPYGTWLQACVLFCTIQQHQISGALTFLPMQPDCRTVLDAWKQVARYWQPPTAAQLPLPTEDEALELYGVARSMVLEGAK